MEVFKTYSTREISEVKSTEMRGIIEKELRLRGFEFKSVTKPVLDPPPKEPVKYAEEIGQIFSNINTPTGRGRIANRQFLVDLFDKIASDPLTCTALYEERVKKYAEKKKAYDKLASRHQADVEAYKKIEPTYLTIKREAQNTVQRAKSLIQRMNKLAKNYVKYLDIAKGDKAIAWDFLKATGVDISLINKTEFKKHVMDMALGGKV